MAFNDPSYVIFDGDNDAWAYRFMRGWKANDKVNFDFRDAHDLDTMTGNAQDEQYVKRNLRARMEQSAAALVLVGENTKNLYKFVRWELDLALQLRLPVIVVNLNDTRVCDTELCPPIIRDACAVHIPFRLKAIQAALDYWPAEFRALGALDISQGARTYSDSVYTSWGL